MKAPATQLETYLYTADDGVMFKLYLDRKTFALLCQLADRQGSGIGGQIRHMLKNAIDRSRHAKCADQVGI